MRHIYFSNHLIDKFELRTLTVEQFTQLWQRLNHGLHHIFSAERVLYFVLKKSTYPEYNFISTGAGLLPGSLGSHTLLLKKLFISWKFTIALVVETMSFARYSL